MLYFTKAVLLKGLKDALQPCLTSSTNKLGVTNFIIFEIEFGLSGYPHSITFFDILLNTFINVNGCNLALINLTESSCVSN
ncbi:hypothetical protein L596_020495 [Steinernema carpocapsae]|uniref:Uncharacterized protein n=1 Tax=Steinernema carpocapsae TaxID=34508 RepID=A0A4U5MUG9_STECR|nr:hypothetical protein L596_020495 [Steinernema carpocapsae]